MRGAAFLRRPSRLPGYAVFSQVSDLLALGQLTSPFKEKVRLSLLQESHIGTILSPVTSGFMTCAPSVGALEQSLTEQLVGQVFPEKLSQCCFHVPHLHALSAVPPLFFQPVAERPISFSLFSGCDDDDWHNVEVTGAARRPTIVIRQKLPFITKYWYDNSINTLK